MAQELHYNDCYHFVTGIGDDLRVLEYEDLDLYTWISNSLPPVPHNFGQVAFSKPSLSINWPYNVYPQDYCED